MKKILSIVGVVAIILMVGCEPPAEISTPNVTAEAINNGGVLRLTWTAITDADGYKVFIDGTEAADITETSYDVETPCKKIEVVAYAGTSESEPATIDLTPVSTSSVEVWPASDPSADHPSGISFGTDGSAQALSIQTANHPNIDYYIEDRNFETAQLMSPLDGNSAVKNTKGNAIAEGSGEENVAPEPGNYESRKPLVVNGIYWLWFDPTNDGWSAADDHYAKAKVTGYDSATNKYTFEFHYQPQAGIRWVVE